MQRGWLLSVPMLLSILAISAHAETLILNDGRRLDGEIIRRDGEAITINTTGGTVVVETSAVSEIVAPLGASTTRPYDFTRL